MNKSKLYYCNLTNEELPKGVGWAPIGSEEGKCVEYENGVPLDECVKKCSYFATQYGMPTFLRNRFFADPVSTYSCVGGMMLKYDLIYPFDLADETYNAQNFESFLTDPDAMPFMMWYLSITELHNKVIKPFAPQTIRTEQGINVIFKRIVVTTCWNPAWAAKPRNPIIMKYDDLEFRQDMSIYKALHHGASYSGRSNEHRMMYSQELHAIFSNFDKITDREVCYFNIVFREMKDYLPKSWQANHALLVVIYNKKIYIFDPWSSMTRKAKFIERYILMSNKNITPNMIEIFKTSKKVQTDDGLCASWCEMFSMMCFLNLHIPPIDLIKYIASDPVFKVKSLVLTLYSYHMANNMPEKLAKYRKLYDKSKVEHIKLNQCVFDAINQSRDELLSIFRKKEYTPMPFAVKNSKNISQILRAVLNNLLSVRDLTEEERQIFLNIKPDELMEKLKVEKQKMQREGYVSLLQTLEEKKDEFSTGDAPKLITPRVAVVSEMVVNRQPKLQPQPMQPPKVDADTSNKPDAPDTPDMSGMDDWAFVDSFDEQEQVDDPPVIEQVIEQERVRDEQSGGEKKYRDDNLKHVSFDIHHDR